MRLRSPVIRDATSRCSLACAETRTCRHFGQPSESLHPARTTPSTSDQDFHWKGRGKTTKSAGQIQHATLRQVDELQSHIRWPACIQSEKSKGTPARPAP